MEQQFDAVLTGSDSSVEGIATMINYPGYNRAYEFSAIDGTIQMLIVQDPNGQWHRVSGSEPYFAGWVDELVEQISKVDNTTAI
ncbi:hypothetical protein [Mucilaginibacter sp. CSA2-8R]|uniref:hypothetical protein n=1 Tax=Mucilaginibacter sp. CSA2-8R TaxID=3141542 RepID=UPI00315C95FF